MSRQLAYGGAVIVLVLIMAGASIPVLAQGGDGVGDQDFSGHVPAIPFPEDVDWLNVPGPLTWDDLRGKVVLLDFWTYGCINCMHIIPDLQRLEEEFPDELVVIGVHSAKFTNEGETENIRQIVQRYGVTHPVVNDSDFEIWRAWGVQAWPTVMLVDPQGMVFGYHAGEGVYDVLQPVIAGMVRQFDEQGLINHEPLTITPELESLPEMPLAFPGKVLADPGGGRLFIADSGHNRIVIADLAGYEVLAVVGGMDAGNQDGSYAAARFNTPQGMALSEDGRILYVADTENHTIRAVDLEAETVATVAGTGQQARQILSGDGAGTGVPLNSPWDLVRVGGQLYIAMAGSHQLWRYDIETGSVAVHSGSGGEGIVDGPHVRAQLAQPSGITTDGDVLYFADSEASAIREADIDPAGSVRTLVGTGLFDFGDRDGVGREALLQHPLGVVYVDGLLYVADTYNSKIRILDPETRELSTLAGNPSGGYQDGPLADSLFDEPGGISHANGFLYVADTNNHAIRVIDLAAGTVSILSFANPEALQPAPEPVTATPAPPAGDQVMLAPQTAASGESVITLDIQVPEGYKFNDLAPFTAVWQPDGTVVQIAEDNRIQRIVEPEMPLRIPATLHEGTAVLSVDLTIYFCEAINESLCFIERTRLNLPVTVDGSEGGSGLVLEYSVEPPDVAPGL